MTERRIKVGRAIRFGVLELALFMLGILFVRREIWQLHATTFTINFWQEGLLIPLSALDGAITGGFASRRRNVQNTPAYKGLLRWATPTFFFLYVGCSALCERLVIGVFPTPAHEIVRSIGLSIVLAGMFLRLWSQLSAPSQLNAEDPDDSRGEVPPRPKPIDRPEPTTDSNIETTSPAIESPPQPSPDAATTPTEPAPQQPDVPSADPHTTDPQPAAPHPIFPAGPHKLLRHPDASGKLLSLVGLPFVFNAWLPLLAMPGIIILLKWHISDQEAFRISQLGEPYLEYRKKTWNLIPYLY